MEYRTTLGMLTVLAVGGKEIKGRSMFSVSPYIAFQMDHIKKKTKVSKGKGKNPKWNDLVEFEIIKGRDVLHGKVMGKEISEDEFIGDIKVDLKPIFQKGYAEVWVPVIHPHKNRHKGDVFLKIQYKPTQQDQGYNALPPKAAPAPGPAPVSAPARPIPVRPPPGAPVRPPQNSPMALGPPSSPMALGPPPGSPMRPPMRPPQLQRSASVPMPIRQNSAGPAPVVIPPRPIIPPRQTPMSSPVAIPLRGASPSIRPYPSPQRQGSAAEGRGRPPPVPLQKGESQSELKHSHTAPGAHPPPSNAHPPPPGAHPHHPPPPGVHPPPPGVHPPQGARPSPGGHPVPPRTTPPHQIPQRTFTSPQINTTSSPINHGPRSPRPVSPINPPHSNPSNPNPNPNGITIPQRMVTRPPLGPRPSN